MKQKKYVFIALYFIGFFKMLAQDPNWSVTNSASYTLDATLILRVKIDNEFLAGGNHKIAAFDSDGVIRGVASVDVNISGSYYAYLSVLSNANNELIKFKIFDANKNKVIDVENETYTFISSAIVGSIPNPFVIKGDSSSLSISENEILGFSFGPNPITNRVLFKGDSVIDSVELYNSSGSRVLLVKGQKQNNVTLYLNKMSAGVYIAVVKSNNKISYAKLIKK